MINQSIVSRLKEISSIALDKVFDHKVEPDKLIINQTKKEFDGNYTLVLFPFAKALRKGLPEIGSALSEYLTSLDEIKSCGVVAGFLNMEIESSEWKKELQIIAEDIQFGSLASIGEKIMIEFSSPNTNKPLHLGHIRNILLGHSCARIYEALGYEVVETQVINDRGIAVCKSMYAWQEFGNGDTPEKSKMKGDHFVGKYYVAYNDALKEEYANFQASEDGKKFMASKIKAEQSEEVFWSSYKNAYFNEQSEIGKATKEMLLKWEAGDPETLALWKKLNDWVYSGFEQTYRTLGVNFTKNYYESDTYKLGKEAVDTYLKKGLFIKEADGSVWIDLEDAGMDKKLVLRSDGTSVYMTQDIGTARKRYEEFKTNKMVYVVGDEQNYHFKVLFEILKQMEEPYADGLYHLSYGMVELPTGKMKSREGTVVDADDLMQEVIDEAKNAALEHGELEDASPEEKAEIYRKVGLAALKFQLIRVNPKKKMVFDPKESVDMQGTTGPYVQNAYVRIQSILRKMGKGAIEQLGNEYELKEEEKELIILMSSYPEILKEAGSSFDPSIVASFGYSLAKSFHKFYHECSVLNAESEQAKNFRLLLIEQVARLLDKSMSILGIEMPQRM